MIVRAFLQKTSNLMAENRLLKFAIVIIGATTFWNSMMLFYAINSQKTILVPPTINQAMKIAGNKADDAYIEEFTRYVMQLAFNYSPATVRQQFDVLLSLYAPEAFAEEKNMLYTLASNAETGRVSSVFYLQRIQVDSSRAMIIVQGLKKQYVDDTKLEDSPVQYYINYKFVRGKFEIIKIVEKSAYDKVEAAKMNYVPPPKEPGVTVAPAADSKTPAKK